MNIGKKILSSFVIFLLLIVIRFSIILASTTPWSQTNWSGGSGQTGWFDNTKYSSTSNINSSATGSLTLNKQSEKLSNTDFESNVLSWSEVATYSAEVANIQSANQIGYWKLNETSGTDANDSSNELNNGTYSGVTLNSSTGPDGQPVGYWDGSTDYVDIYSSAFNTDFDPAEGTMMIWFKVSDVTDWSDSTNRYMFGVEADGNNRIRLQKTNASNINQLLYQAGGTVSANSGNYSSGSSDWVHVALTWSVLADEVKTYINGSQVGSTRTSLGTWSGALSSTGVVIGDASTSSSQPWKGYLAHSAVWSSPLTPTEITSLSSALNITASRDIVTTFSNSSGSLKLVSTDKGIFAQNVNVGNTNTHVLETYAYTDGSAITSSDVELYYNGSTITTTYTDVGSGWYKLSGTLTGADATRDYGVEVKANKTIYLDDMSLTEGFETSGTLTSSVFDAENATAWGNLTFNDDGVQTSSVKVRTSDSSSMIGATDFSSCIAISSGSDISSNLCVTDSHRYIQYQVVLSTSDTTLTPTFQDVSIAFTPGTVASQNYYVDATNGSDSNDGTSTSQAWQSIGAINTAMDSGLIEASDFVYFKRGETFTGSLDINISGTNGKTLTFDAYGSGSNPIIDGASQTTGVDLTGQSYVTVNNIDVKNSTNGYLITSGVITDITISNTTVTNTTYGIKTESFTSVSNFTIDSMTNNSGTSGLLLDTGTYSNVDILDSSFSSHSSYGIRINEGITDLNISGVTSSSNGNTGIYIYGDQSSIVISNTTANLNTGNGLHIYPDTGNTVNNATVSDSVFNFNTTTGIGLATAGTTANITNTTTNDNDHDGISLKGDWTGVTIDGCTSNDNGVTGLGGDGDGYTFHGTSTGTIKNSIARNNKKTAVAHVDTASVSHEYNIFSHETNGPNYLVLLGGLSGGANHTMYNNVIYSDSQIGEGIRFSNNNNITLKNNIVSGFDVSYRAFNHTGTLTEDNNIAYNYGSTAFSGFTEGSNSKTVDPKFVNVASLDFSLQSSSLAINTGVDVGLLSDFLGNGIFGNPDIGAYEFQFLAFSETISPTGYIRQDTKPALYFKIPSDTTQINSYSVTLDSGKNQSYSTTGIPTSGNGTANYIWKNDDNVRIEFFNEEDSDSTNNEIRVYFKGLDNNELTEGEHSWSISVHDSNSNSTTKSADFYIDKTAPSISDLSIANVALVLEDTAYRLDITNRMPSFSGLVSDLYSGSTTQNDNGSEDIFDKVSSGPQTVVLTMERLEDGQSIEAENPVYKEYLSENYSFSDIKDLSNDKKSSRFYITTPFPLTDGYYKVKLSFKDEVDNIYEQPAFYLSLGDIDYNSLIPSLGDLTIIQSDQSDKNLKTEIIEQKITPTETNKEKVAEEEGYVVEVTVVDKDNNPVSGAKVTIHSKVQETTTDEDGLARFSNVEEGDHRVIIAYDDFEGEQKINLTGDVKQFDLTVQVEETGLFSNNIEKVILLVSILTIIGLITFMYKSKKH